MQSVTRLAGKTAIITGGGQGIGAGIAYRLAREGANVVIAEINPETAQRTAQEVMALGGVALAVPTDVRQADQVEAMLDQCVARFGRVDILINNAGVNEKLDLLEITPDQWRDVMAVNVDALFFVLQATTKRMIQQVKWEYAQPSHGKIVNLSSIAGRRGRGNAPQYAASKAAVINITQSAALRLAEYRINVNAVCPGLVWTPLWEALDAAEIKHTGEAPGSYFKRRYEEKVPMKRPASIEDVAGVIAFLCSADADYITGQALNIDGGYEMN
jgi:meso-butanediol dehydrogenase / (S,S)-butanediol dehydrogenase / diacetyl reductase